MLPEVELIAVNLVYIIIITIIIDAYVMGLPKPDWKRTDYPIKHFIGKNNRIDIQTNNECAAFSTAYVLRHYGLEAEGMELYAEFPCKMKSGLVRPKGIIKCLRSRGFISCYYKGNINSLKRQVSKGIPVIVFIKAFADKKYLHFVPVTGYDSENIYLAESLGFLVNHENPEGVYNRKVPVNEFKRLWNIKQLYMPFYSNTYITACKIGTGIS
jgi:ABC-type bacteriocin/lantibiotic exporter with double-glycine peptidase domain